MLSGMAGAALCVDSASETDTDTETEAGPETAAGMGDCRYLLAAAVVWCGSADDLWRMSRRVWDWSKASLKAPKVLRPASLRIDSVWRYVQC